MPNIWFILFFEFLKHIQIYYAKYTKALAEQNNNNTLFRIY